jgi:hypothetical protein
VIEGQKNAPTNGADHGEFAHTSSARVGETGPQKIG